MAVTRSTRNRVTGDEPVRGFESHSLRQNFVQRTPRKAGNRLFSTISGFLVVRQKFPGLWQRIKQDRSAFVIAHLTAGQMERYRLAGGIANGMEL